MHTDLGRYHRQMMFQHIGDSGQEKLLEKNVLIVGCGALGSSIAEMLVRAGVGNLTIIDRDYVDLTNLQRQHLFTEEDVENHTPKVIAAKQQLNKINSQVNIEAVVLDANPNSLEPYLNNIDLVMDATDNFDIRFVINDLCQKYEIPWIFGACVGSAGMSYTILPKKTPCMDCLLKVTPMFGATCDAVGVIGPAVQVVVSFQVTEALKLLVEANDKLRTTLILFDLWQNQFQSIDVTKAKDANCKSCGDNQIYPSLDYANQQKVAVLCGRDTVQIRGKQFELNELAIHVQKFGEMVMNPFLIRLKLEEHEMVFFQDGRVFVHGTNSIASAKKLYYQIVG
jgi:molybdopterin-synthase adenylyltransferase